MNKLSLFFLPQIEQLQNAIYMLRTYTAAYLAQKTVDPNSLDFKKNETALKYKATYQLLKETFFNNGLIQRVNLAVLDTQVNEQGISMYS